MRTVAALAVLAFSIAVLILFPHFFPVPMPLAWASAGIGSSDYDVKQTVNGSSIIPVGKVMNIGNESLTISVVWKQTNATVNMTLPVDSEYWNFTADPGQSFEVAIVVGQYNASFVGNYSGVVDVRAYYAVQGGNAIIPGTEFHVSLVATLPDQPSKPDKLLAFVFAICIIAVASSVGGCFLFRKRHKPLSGPFRGKL